MLFLSGLQHRDAALTPLQVSVTYCRDNKTLHFPSQAATTRKKTHEKKVRTKKFAYTAAETGCVLFFLLLWLSVQEVCTLKGFLFTLHVGSFFFLFSDGKRKNIAVKVKMLAINWPAVEQNVRGML